MLSPFNVVLCGLSFSFLSTRVNVSHLCRRRMDWRFAGLYNLVVLTLNSFVHVVNQEVLLLVCCVVLLCMYSWFVLSVIDEVKTHLCIYALHLTPTPKED